MANMFDVDEKTMAGKVVVKTRENPFGKDKPMLHVVRCVADDTALASKMTSYTDLMKFDDMALALSAFVESAASLVAEGNAVRISGLGTIYITATQGDDGKPQFGVGFAPDKKLLEAAKCAEAKAVIASDSAPLIESVQDLDTMALNTTVTAECNVELRGRRLGIAGEGMDGTGLYMAPCDGDGNYKRDMSDWIRIDDGQVHRNFATLVWFRVPKIAGHYRICIVTRAPVNGERGDEKLMRRARTGASAPITVV